MRTDWIGWAFAAKHESGEDLNAGEKLVLVYLAHQVSADGWGIVENRELCAATSYEVRSVQRILKSLRDSKLLRDVEGHWYALGEAAERCPPPGSYPVKTPVLPGEEPASAEAVRVPGITQAEAEAAGETIAECVNEAADLLLTRLNEFGGRLAGRLVELVANLDGAPAAPPPDPVLESRPYQAAVARGMDHENAYALARELLEQVSEPAAPEPNRAESQRFVRAAGLDRAPTPAGHAYPDSAVGRFARVWDILHSKPPTEQALTELAPVWERFEADENKHSVEGEPAAFELLYPAIVKAAERVAGSMTMREFLDPKAILSGRAPWDTPGAGTLPTDGAMAAEIATMIEAIERANHPRIAVPDRVTEKGDDNVTRTENLGTYYLRVKRVHQQLQHLQQMGV